MAPLHVFYGPDNADNADTTNEVGGVIVCITKATVPKG